MLVRNSMHRAGAEVLSRLLAQPAPAARQSACECGQAARYHDTRPRQVLTHSPKRQARLFALVSIFQVRCTRF